MRTKARGFTLVELLVAIGVMAIVAVLGWRGLDGIVRARVALNNDLEQTRGLQLAFAQLQSDASHITGTADIGGRPILAADDGRLTLVRTVFADDQPSRVQVVAYRLRDGVLTRRESVATRDLGELDTAWQSALADTDTSTQAVALQSDVSAMAVRSWVAERMAWRAGTGTDSSLLGGGTAPMQNQNQNQTPVQETVTGIEVSLRLQGRNADMVKIFLLGAA